MAYKQIKLELDGGWVLQHRENDVLPIPAFIEHFNKMFLGCVQINDSSLTECTLTLKNKDLSAADVRSAIQNALLSGLAISPDDDVVTFTVSEVDDEKAKPDSTKDDEDDTESSESKEDPKQPEPSKSEPKKTATSSASSATSFLDKLTGSHTDSDESDPEETERQIDSLVGADEFKALITEIKLVAPQIIRHNTYEAFVYQNYLFSINDGCGFSTCLKLFAAVLAEKELFQFNGKRVVEEKLPPPGGDRNEQFASLISVVKKGSAGKGLLIGIDISEWMTKLGDPQFRALLSLLENHSANNVYVFRIPFVEKEVLNDITAALEDMLFMRKVSFPPMDLEALTECAKIYVNKLGLTAEEDVWQVFDSRIMEEKSDGRFYGINTVNKIIREMVYKKHLSDARNESDDNVIKKSDIIDISKTFTGQFKDGNEMLSGLVGLEQVKNSIEEILAQIELSHQNSALGSPCIHMRFVGSPGTGKTTVARIIGKILKERGVLRNGCFFEYSGRDFCGRYVGETAPKTAGMCRDAYGSVLFIDEAYSLYRGDDSGRDYGREALETLIAEMENHRNDLVVIMAGYTDEMSLLMKGNPGLESRMPYVIEFPNYTREQLCDIFFKMIGTGFDYDDDFKKAVEEYFNAISDDVLSSKDFSNARFARNLFERTCAKASLRRQLDSCGRLSLTTEDFSLASSERIFKSLITKKNRGKVGF